MDMAKLYNNRFPKDEHRRKQEVWEQIVKNFLQKYVHTNDTVVDIACGFGEFINNIKCSKKIAIDINPESVKYVNKDVEMLHGDCISVLKNSNIKADVIFTSNFLEHLPNRGGLEQLLTEIYNSLNENGRYMILGPNLRYLPGKYWDYYDHTLGITHLSLIEVLNLFNFNVQLCIDKFLPYTIKSNFPTHPLLVKTYIKFPIVWPVFGKQFFIIATKK